MYSVRMASFVCTAHSRTSSIYCACIADIFCLVVFFELLSAMPLCFTASTVVSAASVVSVVTVRSCSYCSYCSSRS